MRRLGDYLFVRHRHNWVLLLRYGLVGGSGVLVNMIVGILCNKIFSHPDDTVMPIPFTDFNVRWYHLYFVLSFLVANLWNFALNRRWTFQTSARTSWWREYLPFLAVGLVTMVIGQLIITALMNTTSPLALPRNIFDGSSGLRTPYYWAQFIAVLVTVPISFVVNKIWTFRAIRGTQPGDSVDAPPAAELQPTDPDPTQVRQP